MKKNEKTSLVFFGSGPVAAESLRLLQSTFAIEAIVTKPTTLAEMRSVAPNTEVMTVSNRLELDRFFEQKKFSSQLAVLIDFGIIVGQNVIDYFPMGIINSHFSLLPDLRGADPISFAVLEGKRETGVSLMLLVEKMDEGPIIATESVLLRGDETTPSLTSKLIKISYELLETHIPGYLAGATMPYAQIGMPSYTRKLTKHDGVIDWSKPADVLEREVRGYTDWPKSQTKVGDIDCIITKASALNEQGPSGKLFVYNKQLAVYCGKNSLLIKSLKPAGKKEMDSRSFLAGYQSRLDIKV